LILLLFLITPKDNQAATASSAHTYRL